MSTPNIPIALTAKVISAFAKSIKMKTANENLTTSVISELAISIEVDKAWSLAKLCGYVWQDDEQFKNWIYGSDKPSSIEILIGGLRNTLEVCCETN